MHNIEASGKAASADQSASDLFPKELLNIKKAVGHTTKQVFNTVKMGI
jgi:hypothetical protein